MDVSNIAFDDLFDCTAVDRDGKKFDRVSRIVAVAQDKGMDLQLDVNVELYPFAVGDRFTLQLARSLTPDRAEQDGYFDASRYHNSSSTTNNGKSRSNASLADDFEYVMYGKVYKFDENKATTKAQVFLSFGGLLMCLEGDPRYTKDIQVGQNFYLLLRKAN